MRVTGTRRRGGWSALALLGTALTVHVGAQSSSPTQPRAAREQPAQAPSPAPSSPTPPGPEGPPPGQPTFRTGVELVTVDVAVVDSRGNPIEDLRAPDFGVKIDGEVRRVVSAELVKADVAAARKAADDRSETFYTSNLTPDDGRHIVIAVDQINISHGALQPIMAAAQRFLDRLSPLDRVAFIAYPEPGPRVNFTNDKLKLKLAMQSLIGQSPRVPAGLHNIGMSEALAIYNRRDQIVMAEVMARECRALNVDERSQCERDLIAQSSEMARRLREDADASIAGLRQLLRELTTVEGHKSLVLLTEGLAVDNQDELASIAALAGYARTSINVLVLDLRRGDITISEQPPTEQADRRLQLNGLEGLAAMSLGSIFHIAGTGEPIFERLSSEISAYYILGVEQRPRDSEGARHRVDVEVRRRGVTIRSRQAFTLSSAQPATRAPDDRLRDTLASPFSVPGLPLRVTTFAHQDPASDRIRLTVAAQVGQPGARKGDFTLGFLLVSDDNRIAASFGRQLTLAPIGSSASEPLAFEASALVDPGLYTLRLGVVDSEGRRGSVVREVSAWKMAGEALAFGDLVLGSTTEGARLRPAVEPVVVGDGLGAYLELYSDAPATFETTRVSLEIADDADSRALTTFDAALRPGNRPTARVVSAVTPMALLPPGRYVARARVTREGKVVGILSRPFVLERGAPVAVSATARMEAAKAFAATLPTFDRQAVLGKEFVMGFLDIVERRSAALKDAMVEARAGRYGMGAVEALGAGDQTAAAFLKGLDLFTKGEWAQAVTQLQIAAGDRREFFPAAFYLGATFAAVGRDRDAAGVWQIALTGEPKPAVVYAMAADARLRDGQAQAAIDILKPAYEREPGNPELARRLAMAYMLVQRYADAAPILDATLVKNAADQEALVASIVAHYELVRAGGVVAQADLTKLRRYVGLYQGADRALLDKYVQAIEGR
jgi:VWFA-related protein